VTNEREEAQLRRLGPDVPPAIPTPMVVGLVSVSETGNIGHRGMRALDPVADAELMRAHGWVRADVVDDILRRLAGVSIAAIRAAHIQTVGGEW
jgi:hypothetical protein